MWFPCVVLRRAGNGLYSVKYPEGNQEEDVPPHELRLPEEEQAVEEPMIAPSRTAPYKRASTFVESDAVVNALLLLPEKEGVVFSAHGERA